MEVLKALTIGMMIAITNIYIIDQIEFVQLEHFDLNWRGENEWQYTIINIFLYFYYD